MSEKSTRPLITHDVSLLLERLLKAAGWEQIRCGWSEGGLYCIGGWKPITHKSKPAKVYVWVHLMPSMHWDFLVLSYFSLALETTEYPNPQGISLSDPGFLQPHQFLEYYGKKRPGIAVLDRLSNDFWSVETGRNLEALFDAYDQLAARVGALQLFQPVPKGKAN